MKINRQGCRRIVFIFKTTVVKIPNFTDGWYLFVRGVLACLTEADRWRSTKDDRLCPINFSMLGFLLVMPRCKELTDSEYLELGKADFFYRGPDRVNLAMWCEPKNNSFGWLSGRIVCYDYDDH